MKWKLNSFPTLLLLEIRGSEIISMLFFSLFFGVTIFGKKKNKRAEI